MAKFWIFSPLFSSFWSTSRWEWLTGVERCTRPGSWWTDISWRRLPWLPCRSSPWSRALPTSQIRCTIILCRFITNQVASAWVIYTIDLLYFIWQREHCQHRRQLTRFNQCAYPSMTSSSKWFLYFKSHRWPQWKVYWSGHDILPTALLTKNLAKSNWRRKSKPKEAPALRDIHSMFWKTSLWGLNFPDLQYYVGFRGRKCKECTYMKVSKGLACVVHRQTPPCLTVIQRIRHFMSSTTTWTKRRLGKTTNKKRWCSRYISSQVEMVSKTSEGWRSTHKETIDTKTSRKFSSTSKDQMQSCKGLILMSNRRNLQSYPVTT